LTASSLMTRHFHPEEISFNFKQAYNFLKIRPASDKFDRMHEMVARLRAQFQSAFAPRYRYAVYRVIDTDFASYRVFLEEDTSFIGSGIYRLLRDSHYAAVFLLTVGGEIDAAVARLTADDFTEAYFLDGVAAAMTHGLLQVLKRDLQNEAGQRRCRLAQRFSPGYMHWDLPEQEKIFHLLKGEEIGITLSEAYVMAPQKSLSGVFGFKAQKE